VSRRYALDDGVAPPYKSSARPHADISTPLRNIQPLNVDDILDDVASCLHISLQRRLSDGDGDTLHQSHAGQRLAQRIFSCTGSPQVKISQTVWGGGYFLTHTVESCENISWAISGDVRRIRLTACLRTLR